MKKTLTKILILLLALAVAVGVSGCVVIEPSNSGDYYEYDSKKVQQKVVETLLDNSLTLAQGVDITSARTSTKMTVENTAKKVRRSSVCIYVRAQGSTTVVCGSGVLINYGATVNQFYILTCFHVVDYENAKIEVVVPNTDIQYIYNQNNPYYFSGYIGGDREQAEQVSLTENKVSLVGGDNISDVAVIKLTVATGNTVVALDIKSNCLAPVSADLTVEYGEQVIAIGNSTGELPGHLSVGYAGVNGRIVEVEDVGSMALLELDVNSYHGNSGGGLYNLYGELVGITNCGDDVNSGINYAIPAVNAYGCGFVEIAEQLIATYKTYKNNYGYVSDFSNNYINIVRNLKFEFVTKQNEKDNSIYVYSIDIRAGGYRAGLRAGDVITSVDNGGQITPMVNVDTLSNIINSVAYQTELKLSVISTPKLGPKTTKEVTIKKTPKLFCNTGDFSK